METTSSLPTLEISSSANNAVTTTVSTHTNETANQDQKSKPQQRPSFTASILSPQSSSPLPSSSPTPAKVLTTQDEVKPTPARIIEDENSISLLTHDHAHSHAHNHQPLSRSISLTGAPTSSMGAHNITHMYGTDSSNHSNHGRVNDPNHTQERSNISASTSTSTSTSSNNNTTTSTSSNNNSAVSSAQGNVVIPKVATVISVMDSKLTDGIVHADVKDVIVNNAVNVASTSAENPKQLSKGEKANKSASPAEISNEDKEKKTIPVTIINEQDADHIPEAIVLGKSTKDESKKSSNSNQISKEHDISDADDSMLIHKESEDEEGDDEAESMILRHVDSFGNLINPDGSIIAEDNQQHSDANENITADTASILSDDHHDKQLKGSSTNDASATEGGADRDTSIFSLSPSMAIPKTPSTAVAMVIGAIDPRSLSSPPQYELKIHIIRGNISGGGLKNVSHVEVRVNEQLIHTTENVPAPPIWNETVHYYLHQLEFPNNPVVISLSLYKKRWTSTGFKLVGTMQLPLTDLSETILDKYGIIEKEYNLNINKWNLTLTGNLYLGFQLRSLHPHMGGNDANVAVGGGRNSINESTSSELTSDGMKGVDEGNGMAPVVATVVTTPVKATHPSAASSSKSSTPVRASLTRRASFRKMDTTYSFKTPVIDASAVTDDQDQIGKNSANQINPDQVPKKEELSEESSLVLKIVEKMGQWMQIDVIFRIWDITIDILGIIFTVLRSINPKIYAGLFIIFIFYLSYSQQQQYKEIRHSISAMETIVQKLERKASYV